MCVHLDGHVVLESVRYPGQHVGVTESGEAKKPSHTGKGTHAQFTPIIITGNEIPPQLSTEILRNANVIYSMTGMYTNISAIIKVSSLIRFFISKVVTFPQMQVEKMTK